MRGPVMVSGGCGGGGVKGRRGGRDGAGGEEVSPAALMLAALKKSMVACSVESPDDVISAVHHPMEIGWPTNVKHVSHVTFDRFNGFLGLPLELEVHVPAPVPSARYFFFSKFVLLLIILLDLLIGVQRELFRLLWFSSTREITNCWFLFWLCNISIRV